MVGTVPETEDDMDHSALPDVLLRACSFPSTEARRTMSRRSALISGVGPGAGAYSEPLSCRRCCLMERSVCPTTAGGVLCSGDEFGGRNAISCAREKPARSRRTVERESKCAMCGHCSGQRARMKQSLPQPVRIAFHHIRNFAGSVVVAVRQTPIYPLAPNHHHQRARNYSISFGMPDIPVGAQIFDLAFHPTNSTVFAGLLTGEIKAFSYDEQGNYESKFSIRPSKRSCRGLTMSGSGDRLWAVGKGKSLLQVMGLLTSLFLRVFSTLHGKQHNRFCYRRRSGNTKSST